MPPASSAFFEYDHQYNKIFVINSILITYFLFKKNNFMCALAMLT